MVRQSWWRPGSRCRQGSQSGERASGPLHPGRLRSPQMREQGGLERVGGHRSVDGAACRRTGAVRAAEVGRVGHMAGVDVHHERPPTVVAARCSPHAGHEAPTARSPTVVALPPIQRPWRPWDQWAWRGRQQQACGHCDNGGQANSWGSKQQWHRVLTPHVEVKGEGPMVADATPSWMVDVANVAGAGKWAAVGMAEPM